VLGWTLAGIEFFHVIIFLGKGDSKLNIFKEALTKPIEEGRFVSPSLLVTKDVIY
jgi:hypothetical protein